MLPQTRAYLDRVFARVIRGWDDLHDYQLDAGDFLDETPFSALFVDVGMGKTIMVYTLLDKLFMEGYENQVLVIAPIRVATRVWMFEHQLWDHTAYLKPTLLRIDDDDPRLAAAYKYGYQRARAKGYDPSMAAMIAARTKTAEKDILRTKLLDDKARIHVIDHGSVEWLVKKWSSRGKWPYKVVISDEIGGLGDYRNQEFRALKHVRKQLNRFHVLTATPSSQTYMKFFSLIWLLDKGDRFGSFITHFRDRYFQHSKYTQEYTLLDGAAEAIEEKIADIVFVLMRDDRNLFIRDHPIRLPRAVMDRYREFESTAILEVPENDPIDAITGAVLSSKLLQFAGGAVYGSNIIIDPDTGEPLVDSKGKVEIEKYCTVVHNEKIEELKEIVEQTLDQPLLVAYWFKSSLERLQKAFPDAAVMDREGRMEEPWNQRKFKMMLVHPRSVGHGMNLQFGGHHLVVFDIFWPLDLFLQLIGRLDRQGQTETVIVHMLSAIGTMDEVVVGKLQYLEDAQTAMFARLRALRAKLRRSQ